MEGEDDNKVNAEEPVKEDPGEEANVDADVFEQNNDLINEGIEGEF
jgi:hypothetical protein